VDGPLANDTIAYSYDEQGRTTGRSINGVGLTQSFDALGRITGETNALGSFSYAFAGTTRRPTSATYPNGQTTTFDYFDNLGERRLKEIHNKLSGGATLSKFNYTREATGRLKTAAKQLDSGAATTYEYGFDPADQLTSASLRDASAAVLKSYGYGYDKAGNRTVESIDSSTVAGTFNNVNQLLSQQVGGALRFAGTVNEPANVTVAGAPAQVTADNRFQGSAPVTGGTNTVAVTATDPSGNARTNTYQVNVTGAGTSFTYDSNGNLTSDGSRTFEWDAENRLAAVNQGTRRSEFTYDGTDLWARIVEKDGAAVLSDHRYVWCGLKVCEERDASGAAVTKRFFDQGVQEGADNFFYTGDQLGSIREMTDAAGTVRARYDYDPYGRRTKVAGDKEAVLGFTGHFFHAPSGLTLAPYRAYDASLGRWISEDPTGLGVGDPNRYRYVWNSPTGYVDPTGEVAIAIPVLAAFGLVLTTAVAIYYIQHGPPPMPIPVNPLPPVPPSQPVTNPVTQPPAPPAGGPPAAPAPPAAPPAPMPMAPPTPMPPPVPPVPVPTKPTIQVPSGPKPCPPQKPSNNMCVQAALCLAQAKGFAKLRCVPLIIACIAQTAGGGAGGGGKP
jgi:RHS repeat-associated protein